MKGPHENRAAPSALFFRALSARRRSYESAQGRIEVIIARLVFRAGGVPCLRHSA